MNLNRLYKIFGSRPPLSRKDIADYGRSNDPRTKHSVEMKEASDPFEADAMEGWESMSYDVGVMKNLDKKFLKPSNWGWYIGGTAVVAAAVCTYIALGTNNINSDQPEDSQPQKITSLVEGQEVTLEQSDLVLPDSINEMKSAPEAQQVEVKKIQKEFKEMKTSYTIELPPKVEMLPLENIQIGPSLKTPELVREHRSASEIYLHDLKLVDYRKYRTKPAIRTKQVVLTGTPANLEDDGSEDVTPEFREIEIPYIEYLDKTMSRFSRGSYKNALSRFDIILETYSDDVNANFYSGLCLFNLGEYEAAITRFINCTTGPYSNFDEEAQWMTALCYEESGQTDKAKSYFQKIIDQGGYYKKQAIAKMK